MLKLENFECAQRAEMELNFGINNQTRVTLTTVL